MTLDAAASPDHRIPRAALWLGFAGLLPFLAGAAGSWLATGGLAGGMLLVLIVYAGTILSFMGGVHWGLAMAQGDGGSWRRLGFSVMPALVAWPALVLSAVPGPALLMLMTAFALLLVHDLFEVRAGRAPAWYPALRWRLTLGVEASLAVALARVAGIG
jgi:hypothetical protein